MRIPIKGDITDAKQIWLGQTLACAPQHCPHPRGQLAGTERFGHIIIRAKFQPQHFIVFFEPGSQHNDWCCTFLSVGAKKLKAPHFRHHQVKHNQIRRRLARNHQRLVAISGGEDVKPFL